MIIKIKKEVVDLVARANKFIILILITLCLSSCAFTNDVYNDLGGRNEIVEDINDITSTVVKANIKIVAVLFSKTEYRTYIQQGSGIIYKEDESNYYAITNAHIFTIEDDEELKIHKITVYDYTTECEYSAKISDIDEEKDMALVNFRKNADYELTTVTFANSVPSAGEIVYSIGNPMGQMNAINAGKYIALIDNVEGFSEEVKFIQSDVVIDHGNSGGMLLNQDLEVIGMNTVSLTYCDEISSGSINYSCLLEFIEKNLG